MKNTAWYTTKTPANKNANRFAEGFAVALFAVFVVVFASAPASVLIAAFAVLASLAVAFISALAAVLVAAFAFVSVPSVAFAAALPAAGVVRLAAVFAGVGWAVLIAGCYRCLRAVFVSVSTALPLLLPLPWQEAQTETTPHAPSLRQVAEKMKNRILLNETNIHICGFRNRNSYLIVQKAYGSKDRTFW